MKFCIFWYTPSTFLSVSEPAAPVDFRNCFRSSGSLVSLIIWRQGLTSVFPKQRSNARISSSQFHLGFRLALAIIYFNGRTIPRKIFFASLQVLSGTKCFSQAFYSQLF